MNAEQYQHTLKW